MAYTKTDKAKCFISFDYDNDKALKELLVGQSKLEDSPFEISDWSIKEPSADWKEKARMRIKRAEIVIIMCGKNTNTANGVSIEMDITIEEGKDYFLLAGYSDGGNKKPKSAEATDKLYKWTWNNLKSLIHGSR